MQDHLNGIPIPRMMADNGAEGGYSHVGYLAYGCHHWLPGNLSCFLHCGNYIFILQCIVRRDWIHVGSCTASSLYQMLLLWNGDEAKVIKADLKPFMVEVHTAEVVYYYSNIIPYQVIKNKVDGKPEVAKIRLLIVAKEWKAINKELFRPVIIGQRLEKLGESSNNEYQSQRRT
ncbi:hypothetical protein ACH5RR_008844 [Cinchona calisaya]|uniref:Uncharacterized protein n=1 Tax=Cinchona calisaya TaxID=153742 RepID=A0ABD3AFI2_9GENT